MATPWTAVLQASLFLTVSQSLVKFMSIELMMPSNHLILCHPFLLLPSIFPTKSSGSEKKRKKVPRKPSAFSKVNSPSGSTCNARQRQFCAHCPAPAQTHLPCVQGEVLGVLLPGPHTYQQAASLPDPLSDFQSPALSVTVSIGRGVTSFHNESVLDVCVHSNYLGFQPAHLPLLLYC